MAIVNSTKPRPRDDRTFRRRGAIAILATLFCYVVAAQDFKAAPEQSGEDRLSPAEEEFAYATKNPTDRVAAFLKIADRKMETAKRFRKAGSLDEMNMSLSGYGSALQGALMAVAWGEDVGANMQRQEIAIRKTIRRHSDILNKLESTLPTGPNPAITQARAALASAVVAEPLR